jgi:predicted nucleic acid-binding protein
VKTYVFDASALFVYLQKKTSTEKVGRLLKEANMGGASIFMSAVNYGEFYAIMLRLHGSDRTLAVMHAARSLPMDLVDATPARAVHAANIKTTHRLHYADSFAAALALEYKATLVTSDSDFRRLGHAFPVVWLKN